LQRHLSRHGTDSLRRGLPQAQLSWAGRGRPPDAACAPAIGAYGSARGDCRRRALSRLRRGGLRHGLSPGHRRWLDREIGAAWRNPGGDAMRLIEFTQNGRTRPGVWLGDQVIDVGALGCPASLQQWLAAPPEVFAQLAAALAAGDAPAFAMADVRLEAPIRAPTKIIA